MPCDKGSGYTNLTVNGIETYVKITEANRSEITPEDHLRYNLV